MAKMVVARSQQLEMARKHPKPVYSRVVSVACNVIGDGVWRYVTTPPMGQNLWLLKIDVWRWPRSPDISKGTEFRFFGGSEEPGSVEALERWEEILPVLLDGKTRHLWRAFDGTNHLQWTMMRFFEGRTRRLALMHMRQVGFGNDAIYVSYEISEG